MRDIMRIRPVLALLALAACTPDPGLVGVPGMRVATDDQIKGCTYVTNMTVTPSVYGVLAEEGLRYSRNQLLAMARDSGADTVVFEVTPPGQPVYKVNGVAWRCGR